jgi:hypothetical protein
LKDIFSLHNTIHVWGFCKVSDRFMCKTRELSTDS